MIYATIKQEDEEEICEPITTQGEGGGETEQSIPEGMINNLLPLRQIKFVKGSFHPDIKVVLTKVEK